MAKILTRIIITAALFYLIFRSVEIKSVMNVIRDINFVLLIPAVLLQIGSTLVAAYRWYLIMHILEFGQSVFYYIGSYFKGTFFNQALPTSIGGDAVRILDAGKLGNGNKEAFFGVFIDRVAGLSGLLLLNLIAIIASPDLLPRGIQWLITFIAVAGICGVFVLLGLKHINWLTRYKITRVFHHISIRINRVYHSIGSAVTQTALSLLIHLLAMTCVFLIGRSVGLDLPYLAFLVLVPPALLLTIIPVSLAGWGVRESALIGLFLIINSETLPEKSVVLSMSLLYGILLIIVSLPGLYFYLTGHTHKLAELSHEIEDLTEEIAEEIAEEITTEELTETLTEELDAERDK